ncbi:PAS domain S-box protein [Blastococcus sp. MG754426]|uniref:SpoIIE family protein phosphatase n=1 Tax=unclassified Blastococcus TaxID=2619396 RepID=UPI001EEFF308|nr:MULTISPECIES: SpoIIE family protein phosphatase [unclassified Blastococcus]MCF6509277.1 PAS domain S-box protein [Blastococcus sp. MG754426]MCF6512479.1 PAS domain S-box protein [Blastococcus sp. MG754427]MCF6736897.1 PAS domain S-box protein [Blastococcus sp. KM273129]
MPEATSGVPAATLLAALPDTVVVADSRGRVTYVNPAVSALLGYAPADLLGRDLTEIMPTRFRSGHSGHINRFLTTGRGELVGNTTQLPALHVDGHEVSIDVTLARVEPYPGAGAEEASIVGVLRDASTTILLERQLQVSRYLAATLRVTAALTEAADADVAFHQLLPTLCTELDWDAALLWQADPDHGRLVHAGTWAAPGADVPALAADAPRRVFRRGEGLPGRAWSHRVPVVVEDLTADPRVVRRDEVRADGLSTGVAFPVLSGDTLLAVCELFSTQSRPVPPELLEVLGHAGRQIGQFLARLRAESVVRELADTLQRSLLPSHLPSIPGVELAATYRAGGEAALVGGDTYDVTPLPDGRWMVLIADVCGTGAEAAAVTAVTRHTARAAAASGSAAAILGAVNAALLHEQGSAPLRFVTACCLVLEPAGSGQRASISVAGHPLPLLRHPDGTTAAVGTAGRPLGIDAGVTFAEEVVDLPPGATLVLYTDGVTEARDDRGVQYGEEALLRVVGGVVTGAARETIDAVSGAVERQLAGSRHEHDDLAVLALSVPR